MNIGGAGLANLFDFENENLCFDDEVFRVWF